MIAHARCDRFYHIWLMITQSLHRQIRVAADQGKYQQAAQLGLQLSSFQEACLDAPQLQAFSYCDYHALPAVLHSFLTKMQRRCLKLQRKGEPHRLQQLADWLELVEAEVRELPERIVYAALPAPASGSASSNTNNNTNTQHSPTSVVTFEVAQRRFECKLNVVREAVEVALQRMEALTLRLRTDQARDRAAAADDGYADREEEEREYTLPDKVK